MCIRDRHDLKHDYQLLQYYLTEKDYSRVQELMSSKKDIVDSMPTLLSTHNKLLNTVINGKILESYSKNIKVESVISIHDINFCLLYTSYCFTMQILSNL